MGRDAHTEVVGSMGLYPREDLQEYLQRIGEELAATSERPDLPWTFRVLDEDVVNAFALPGGFIYMTRGIMAHLESEAELAGILGHEIGHVTARHSVNRMSRAQLAQLGLGLGMILAPDLQRFQGLAGASLQLLFLKFSRDDERESDMLGVRYMSQTGYEPTELAGVMEMLGRVSAAHGGGGPPEWLSTHPNPSNREERIREMAREAEVTGPSSEVDRESYIQRLDGLVYGQDPRQGFFRQGHFYHPGLAFQMNFPRGWPTANLDQSVQAVSPDEDAIVALTLSEERVPEDALRTFLAQEGLEGGTASREPVNGLPAARADFRVNTEQGILEGRVVFLRYGDNTFRLLGYAPESRWDARRDAVSGTLTSFRPLEDSRYLDVEPARLEIVTLRSSMSLRRLLEQRGATEWEEDVRLLNRLDGNPTLEAGRMMKIPVGGRLPGGD